MLDVGRLLAATRRMPTIFSHAVFSTALGAAYTSEPMPPRFWVSAALCSVVADLDVLAFVFGIPYGDPWGHRGLTHSVLFSVAIGALAAAVVVRHVPEKGFFSLGAFFSVAALTHPLLDALTNGGLGVALLAPVSSERYFAPWRPIQVSPLGVGFFSWRGARVLGSEFVWVWAPAAAVALVGVLRRRSASLPRPR